MGTIIKYFSFGRICKDDFSQLLSVYLPRWLKDFLTKVLDYFLPWFFVWLYNWKSIKRLLKASKIDSHTLLYRIRHSNYVSFYGLFFLKLLLVCYLPSLAIWSASISGQPRDLNICDTVLLPVAIPPVNPIINIFS